VRLLVPELLLDPYTWVVAIVLVLVATAFGRLRHEPWWTIAATAIGANAFLIGIRWATTLGQEAFWAAALAAAGFGVWTEVAARSRRRSAAARGHAP
jgi:hypothetical protein